MQKKEVIIDVHDFEEIGNKKYYTIDEIEKIINIPQSKIVYYCNKLNDYLNIQTVGMYQIFDSCDLDNLKKIKELNIDKKMNITEIKKHLKEHNQEVLVRKEQTIDITFVEVFAKIMENQNNKMESILDNYNKMVNSQASIINILESQSNYIKLLDENMGKNNNILKDELAISVDEIVAEKLEQQQSQIDNIVSERLESKLEVFKEDFIQQMQEELTATKEDSQNIAKMRELLEHRKEDSKSTQKTGLFSKLFRKQS